MCQNFSIILSRRKNSELKRHAHTPPTPPRLKVCIFQKKQEKDRFFSPSFPWKAVMQVRHPTEITGSGGVSKCSQEYGLNRATLGVLFITSMSLKFMHFGIHLPFHYL